MKQAWLALLLGVTLFVSAGHADTGTESAIPAVTVKAINTDAPKPELVSTGDVAYVGDFLEFTLKNSTEGVWTICPQYGCWYDSYTGSNVDGSYTTILVPRVVGTYHIVVSVVVDSKPVGLTALVEVLDAKVKPGPDDDKDKKDDKKDDKQDDKKDDEKKDDTQPSKLSAWIAENKDLIVVNQATFDAEVAALVKIFNGVGTGNYNNYRAMASDLAREARDALVSLDAGSADKPAGDARWGTFINALGKKIDTLLGSNNQNIAARKELYIECANGLKALTISVGEVK